MLKSTATEARGAHREREEEAEKVGGGEESGEGGSDRREMRWG